MGSTRKRELVAYHRFPPVREYAILAIYGGKAVFLETVSD
jgi:hypothetical protein